MFLMDFSSSAPALSLLHGRVVLLNGRATFSSIIFTLLGSCHYTLSNPPSSAGNSARLRVYSAALESEFASVLHRRSFVFATSFRSML